MWYALAAVAVLIVLGLAFYLGKLLSQLAQQKQQQQQAQQALERKRAEHQQYLLDSIVLIARATLEGQCELSEGALRIWVLLENLQPELAQACRYPGLFAMYDCVKDMPTHEAWTALEKPVRRKLDHQRQQTEISQKSAIMADLTALLQVLEPKH
jgi:hypothetical protein